jgi:hypothetical protein
MGDWRAVFPAKARPLASKMQRDERDDRGAFADSALRDKAHGRLLPVRRGVRRTSLVRCVRDVAAVTSR